MYCDKTGALQLAVSKAIRALADRTPATAPAPTAPDPCYQAEASRILAVEEKAERGLAVEQQSLEMQKQKLAMHLLAATVYPCASERTCSEGLDDLVCGQLLLLDRRFITLMVLGLLRYSVGSFPTRYKNPMCKKMHIKSKK